MASLASLRMTDDTRQHATACSRGSLCFRILTLPSALIRSGCSRGQGTLCEWTLSRACVIPSHPSWQCCGFTTDSSSGFLSPTPNLPGMYPPVTPPSTTINLRQDHPAAAPKKSDLARAAAVVAQETGFGPQVCHWADRSLMAGGHQGGRGARFGGVRLRGSTAECECASCDFHTSAPTANL